MKFNILTFVAIFLVFFSLSSTVKLVVNVINGRILLRKAKNSGKIIIKGVNSIYKLSNYLVAILSETFITYIVCKLAFMYKVHSIVYVFVGIVILTLLATVIIHIIALFAEKDVYLTESGLIYFLGSFKFSDCRFSWDSSDTPDKPSDKLYIYKRKAKMPFVASFENDREAAHRIVNDNSVTQQ